MDASYTTSVIKFNLASNRKHPIRNDSVIIYFLSWRVSLSISGVQWLPGTGAYKLPRKIKIEKKK